MWIASLLTSSAASFGRLLIVGLLPNAMPLVFLWLLVRAHSFSGASHWSMPIPTNLGADILGVFLSLLAITLLTILVQPFQLRMIRLLEGYWDGWWLTAQVAPFFVEYQTRRKEAIADQIDELEGKCREIEAAIPENNHNLDRKLKRQLARTISAGERKNYKLLRYPPPTNPEEPETPLLPTALGNALRTGETSAGERYGLWTIGSWPRLYPLLSDKLSATQASARDALDASANFCISFFAVFALAIVALLDEPKAYWMPALALALCFVSYIGAIAAAVTFTTYLRVAYDLHRFDLLKAMHYPLPDTPKNEYEQFTELSDFFRAEAQDSIADGLAKATFRNLTYDHTDKQAEDDDPQVTTPH